MRLAFLEEPFGLGIAGEASIRDALLKIPAKKIFLRKPDRSPDSAAMTIFQYSNPNTRSDEQHAIARHFRRWLRYSQTSDSNLDLVSPFPMTQPGEGDRRHAVLFRRPECLVLKPYDRRSRLLSPMFRHHFRG
jgi:hypothetical protein